MTHWHVAVREGRFHGNAKLRTSGQAHQTSEAAFAARNRRQQADNVSADPQARRRAWCIVSCDGPSCGPIPQDG